VPGKLSPTGAPWPSSRRTPLVLVGAMTALFGAMELRAGRNLPGGSFIALGTLGILAGFSARVGDHFGTLGGILGILVLILAIVRLRRIADERRQRQMSEPRRLRKLVDR